MKRRSFLRLLGLAPVVAAAPGLAMPRPESPKDIITGLSAATDPQFIGSEQVSHPIVYEGGQFYLNAGSIRSSNGKLVIDMHGGNCSIRIHD